MKRRNIAQLFSLTLTLFGLISLNTTVIDPSGQAVQAATNSSLTELDDQPSLRALANGRIAFVSEDGASTNIHTIDSDGGDRMRLTVGHGDLDPVWSPDGTQIVFVRTYNSCNRGEVFVMNADGSKKRVLAEAGHYRHPTWSPDGTRIAFVRALGCTDSGVLVVMNADGSNQRTIDQGFSTQPAWSPDGSRIAFAESGNILLVNADGSNRSVIASPQSGAYYRDPAWSPDGSRLAFTREADCDLNDCYSYSLWTVTSDGSIPILLADVYAYGLSWSPDGTKIIFSSGADLFAMNADGSDIANITNTIGEREFFPSWQALPLTGCADSISSAQQSFEPAGGTGSVDVTARNECSWTASSNGGWISVTSGFSSGSGSVVYSVAANTSTRSRSAGLVVGGYIVSIRQAGLPVRITSALVAGEKLFVLGENFASGAVILLNGNQQKTKNNAQDPKARLIGKKAGKEIKPGDKLQVRNPNGTLSQEFTFTGS